MEENDIKNTLNNLMKAYQVLHNSLINRGYPEVFKEADFNTKMAHSLDLMEKRIKTFFQKEIEEMRGTLRFIAKKIHTIEERLTKIELKETKEVEIAFQLIDKTPPKLTKENKEIFENATNLLLNSLTIKERGVLIHRYGLLGEKPKTLEETAPFLKMKTRESVRQTQSKAIRKCRHPSRHTWVHNLPFSQLKCDITGEDS